MASKGLTQKDLATKLGKSEAEISKWMRGTHNFTISTIKKIEVALDCEILSVKKTLDGSVFFLYNSSYTTYPISKSVKNADTIVNASNGLKMVYNGNWSFRSKNIGYTRGIVFYQLWDSLIVGSNG